VHCHFGKSKVQSAESDGRVGRQVLNPLIEKGLKCSNASVATRNCIIVEKGWSNISINIKILKTRYVSETKLFILQMKLLILKYLIRNVEHISK